MSNTNGHVLVVDNDVKILSLCRLVVEQAGLTAHTFETSHHANHHIRNNNVDIALIGTAPSASDSLRLIDQLRDGKHQTPIVVLANHSNDALVKHAPRFTPHKILVKPISATDILRVIVNLKAPARALEQRIPALLQINRCLLSDLDPKQLYTTIVETVCNELAADHAALFLWHPNGRTLDTVSMAGEPLHAQVGRRASKADYIAHQVAITGQPNLQTPYQPTRSVMLQNDQSILSVPLLAGDRVLGVLQAVRNEAPFDKDDTELLQLLTGQVTVAVENARLYSLAQQRTERLDTLYRISTAIAGSLDLEVITATTLQQIGATLPLVQAQILLVHPNATLPAQRRLWRNDYLTPLTTTRLPQPNSLLARTLADGTPRIEPVATERTTGASDKRQEVACVVLRSEQQTCGAIELTGQQGFSFSDDDVQFLVALSVPLALAVEKARLHTDIAASEARNRALLEYANDAVLLLDSKGKHIIDANRSMEQLAGYSRHALQALAPTSLLTTVWQDKVPDSDSQEVIPPFETTLHTRDQSDIPVSVGISRVPYSGDELLLLIIRDISERQRMVQHVVQTEKLAAIGRLASSIAHEVNNPLQAIFNTLDLLRKNDMSAEKRQRYLDMSYAEAERLIGIVHRLIDFHRPSRDGMLPTNMLDLLTNLLAGLDEQLKEHTITVVREWSVPQPRIMAIRSHLKQVCTNLILNAIDAMPKGGTLTIRVSQEPDERVDTRMQQHLPHTGKPVTGTLLVIDFHDTGHGIATHDLTKIFEPFYTTKVTGTGLGLAISYNIVQQHGGDLTVTSTPGNGTIFRLRLPTAE